MLSVLPEILKEDCFALHGGTAINLFLREMPRLSVDIDLTYLLMEDRKTTLNNISKALESAKARILFTLPGVSVNHQRAVSKLLVSGNGASIKVEVNQTIRGTLEKPEKRILCQKAQEEFNAFCAVHVVQKGQVFGGKICAALDRQHPRDLFDVNYLLQAEGFNADIKTGFLFSILSSKRPIHELLNPNLNDQRLTFDNQFDGMSLESFTYRDFEAVRKLLLKTVQSSLTQSDKTFLLGFKNLEPNWSLYDFEAFPSVQWKLQNLKNLKESNPEKHRRQLGQLKKLLSDA